MGPDQLALCGLFRGYGYGETNLKIVYIGEESRGLDMQLDCEEQCPGVIFGKQ